MTEQLVIRLKQTELDSSTAVDWCLINSSGQVVDNGCTPISQFRDQFTAHDPAMDITVIAPAESLLLTRTTVPSKNIRQIKQALPYMVEELITDDIEDVHIAIPRKLDVNSDDIDVAVIQHKTLINWLDILVSNGLAANRIVIDLLCIPFDTNSWTMLIDGSRLMLRIGDCSGMVIAVDDCEFILEALLAQHRQGEAGVMPKISLLSASGEPTDQPRLAELAATLRNSYPEYDISERQYQESVSEILLHTCTENSETGIDLLQGGYSVDVDTDSRWQRWKMAVSVAAIGLFIYLASSIGSGWYFSSQADDLDRQAVALYRQLFPAERRIVSPKKQMQNHLRQSGYSSNTDFMVLLAATAGQLGKTGSALPLSFQQLQFSAERGALQFEVQGQSLEQLEQLKQTLADASLDVDINSATEQDSAVIGRIVVRNL